MTIRNKILVIILSATMIICMSGFVSESASTQTFDCVEVTVLDKTTPAVNLYTKQDKTSTYFISVTGKEVGIISYSDFTAIAQKNKRVINLPGGGTWGSPPVDGKSWEEWFADEFNEYRALDPGSREKAVKTHRSEIMESYRQEVISLVNEEREKNGLPALQVNEEVMVYAQDRAKELVTSYSHTRPDGKEKPYDTIGAMNENIARGQYSPSEVMEDWMNSPGHRGNILNDDAYAIGVGCYWTGVGFYWSQEFLW